MTSTSVVTIWENVSHKNTDGNIFTEELTISKQTTSDVYCQPCHDIGAYFRMQSKTFYEHLKREHNSILSAAVSCNICHQKFNNLNAVKKHLSKHKELKFKDILKYQCIRQSEKSIIMKSHEQHPKPDPPAKNDLSTQTCQLCPYSTNYSKPAKILIANPNYKPVHSKTDIRKLGKYC